METNEVQSQDRPIAKLLTFNTFQGMTDTEIESVIQWRLNRAVINYQNSEQAKTNAALKETMLTMRQEQRAEALNVLKCKREQAIPFIKVGYNSEGLKIE